MQEGPSLIQFLMICHAELPTGLVVHGKITTPWPLYKNDYCLRSWK